jgi:hypothetical protein
VRNEEVLLRVNEQRNILHEIRKRKPNWIGHSLPRNCLLKQVIEGKIKGDVEVTRRREIRRKTLLADLKDRSEVIRKQLEIYGIQAVRSKYKRNWINLLERMDNTRLPKHGLNYKHRGRRDRGRPRIRWQRVDAGPVQTT